MPPPLSPSRPRTPTPRRSQPGSATHRPTAPPLGGDARGGDAHSLRVSASDVGRLNQVLLSRLSEPSHRGGGSMLRPRADGTGSATRTSSPVSNGVTLLTQNDFRQGTSHSLAGGLPPGPHRRLGSWPSNPPDFADIRVPVITTLRPQCTLPSPDGERSAEPLPRARCRSYRCVRRDARALRTDRRSQ